MATEMHARTTEHEAEATRERILQASQKLFAEKGFDSTSVRDITTEAGCNVASVNYHFGGKENLYLEAFRSMLAALRQLRLSALEEIISLDPAPNLEEFLAAFAEGFIDPLVEESRGRLFMVMVSREMFDPRLPHEVFLNEFIHPVMERTMTALDRFAPGLEPEAAQMCIMSMVGQLLHALKAHHLFVPGGDGKVVPPKLAEYIPHFVRYSAAGIRACSAPSAADDREQREREAAS